MNAAQAEGIMPVVGPIPVPVQGIPVVLPPKPKKDFKKRGRFQVMSVEEDEFPNPNGTNAEHILLADPNPLPPNPPNNPPAPFVTGQTGEADLLAFASPPAPLSGLVHLAQPPLASPLGPANITPERKQGGRATLDGASSIASDSSDDEEDDDEDEEGREKGTEKSSHPRGHQRRHSRQLSGTLAIPPPDRKAFAAAAIDPHSPSTFELRLSRPPSVTIASPTGSVDGNNDTTTLAEIQQMTEDLEKLKPPNPSPIAGAPTAPQPAPSQGPLWHPPPAQYQFIASPHFHHQLPQPQFLQQPLPHTFYPYPVYFDPRAAPSPMPVVSPVHIHAPTVYAYGGQIPATPPSVRKSSRRHHELAYEDIKFCEKIGEGTFGEVYRGTLWGQEVALKKLRLSSAHGREFKKEVKIMKNLRHPNIVEFLGATFETAEKMVIVTEYLPNGSLADLLEEYQKKGTKLTKKRILLIAKDVARGLNWLHHKNIIHRDLKPANLLIDPNRKVKIADFGLAHVKKTKMSNTQFYGMFGTPCYMAPEVLKKLPYDFKADVFSFGIVLCELVTGKYPYEQAPSSMMTFEKAILAGLRPEVPQNCVPAMQKLITDCWAENPNDRPTVDQIMERLFLIEEQQLALAQHSILDELPEEAHTLFLENQKRMAEMQTLIETHKTQYALLADALKDETNRRREADDRHAQCYAQLIDAQQEVQRLRAEAASRHGLSVAEPLAASAAAITTDPALLVPRRLSSDDPPSARSASGSASPSGQLELPLSARSEPLGEADSEPIVSVSLESESCGEDEDEPSIGHSRSVSLAEEGDSPSLPADLGEHKVPLQPSLAPIAESPSVYHPHHHSSHSSGLLSGLPRLVTGLSLLDTPVHTSEDPASPDRMVLSARRLEAEFAAARAGSPTVPHSPPRLAAVLPSTECHELPDQSASLSAPIAATAVPELGARTASRSSSSPVSSIDPSPPSFTSVLNPSSLFSVPTPVVAVPSLISPHPPEPAYPLIPQSASELSLEGIPSSSPVAVAPSPLPVIPSSPAAGLRSGEVTPRPELPLLPDPLVANDAVSVSEAN